MGEYVFKKFSSPGTETPFDVDGTLVETYGPRPYNDEFVALVELDGDEGGDVGNESDVEVSPERVEEESDEDFTCIGKDGDCSRTVDKENGRCWQHPADDE